MAFPSSVSPRGKASSAHGFSFFRRHGQSHTLLGGLAQGLGFRKARTKYYLLTHLFIVPLNIIDEQH